MRNFDQQAPHVVSRFSASDRHHPDSTLCARTRRLIILGFLMATKQDGAKLVRHESMYLSDGDVVLAAEQYPTTTVLFRVDKIYLARNSAVFRSMFTLPDRPSVNELYDGVPKVRLSDDADDLARLLAALYDPT